jgi:hypothetical protein
MATRIETLIDQVKTNLGADAGIDATKVFSNRVADLNDTELPAYNVVLGPDNPINELGPANVAFIDWEQALFIDLYERSILDDIDAVFLTMRRNVHRALMADVTQGLNFVLTTVPAGADEPIISDEGERKNMVYRTNWLFWIRTSINDLETT